MKIKTSELTGSALDWAVAIIEHPKGSYGGEASHYSGNRNERWICIPDKANRCWVNANYSTDWAQGGPIIERECINIAFDGFPQGWVATFPSRNIKQFGETPLIAAMRCYVASKLGDEVEIPDELVKP